MSKLTRMPQWSALQNHYREVSKLHLRELFAHDRGRFDRFCLRFNDILIDYSKNRITQETMRLLLELAEAVDLKAWIGRMFSGEKINVTENRAVLHVALRNRSNHAIMVDGRDVMPEVNRVLQQMKEFCVRVSAGLRSPCVHC